MARVPDARSGECGNYCGHQGGFDCDVRTVDRVPKGCCGATETGGNTPSQGILVPVGARVRRAR